MLETAGAYGDLSLPLLDIVIDVEALRAHEVEIDWADGAPRILDALPMSSEVILAEGPLPR